MMIIIDQINNWSRRAIFSVLAVALAMTIAAQAPAQTRAKRTTTRATTAKAPAPRYAYEFGYRSGYDDGMVQGRADFNNRRERDHGRHEAYSRADRGYEVRMGAAGEYQGGYRIGYEVGYSDGYYGRTASTAWPGNLKVLAAAAAPEETVAAPVAARDRTVDRQTVDQRIEPQALPPLVIRNDMQVKIRLNNRISTKESREGDTFTATVLDPSELADAEVTGHVGKINRSGSATGKTEISMVFDSIRMRDGRTAKFNAQIERVYESETVRTVDEEGNVQTGSRTKDTVTRTGGGAALGAIIGAIAGGGKGAAIGAIIGAGVGVGSVYVEGNKNLVLEPGTEILVRTAGPRGDRN
jgi:hypothetical protein